MILFKDNPDLKTRTVTTVSGDKEYRDNCRLISGKFHVMQKDCFFIESEQKWYRTSDKICFDHEKKVWVIKDSSLIHGIIGVKDKIPEFGFFSKNDYNNVSTKTINWGLFTTINSNILDEDTWIEDLGTGVYYLKHEAGENTIKKFQKIHNVVNHHNSLAYTIEENKQDFENKIENFNNYPTKISKEVLTFSKYIGDLTFGAEFEFFEGVMPTHLQHRTGIVPVRDGSVGGELVTVPMKGAKGIQNICDVADIMKKYTNIDINCSLHYHIGNISLERLNVVTLYILGYKIQKDFFSMFPYYKTDHRGIKKHNYCKQFKKLDIHALKDFSKEGFESYINELYVRIYTYFSDGTPPDMNNNRRLNRHPVGAKWNQVNRKSFLNLCNMLFSPRGTIEFRIFPLTTNKIKAIAWFFMCCAIVKYAEHNVQKILSTEEDIPFEEVLNYYQDHFPKDENAKFLSEYLIHFYRTQKEVFENDFRADDRVSMHDITSDKKFKFSYKGISLFDTFTEKIKRVVKKNTVVETAVI